MKYKVLYKTTFEEKNYLEGDILITNKQVGGLVERGIIEVCKEQEGDCCFKPKPKPQPQETNNPTQILKEIACDDVGQKQEEEEFPNAQQSIKSSTLIHKAKKIISK